MSRYYTRACNFYYGSKSKILVKQNKSIPLNGRNEISFDKVEIISRRFVKKISKQTPIKMPIKRDYKSLILSTKNPYNKKTIHANFY